MTTIHYPAQFAAEGGHGVTLPEMTVDAFDNAPMSLVIRSSHALRFAVVDGQGQVFIESETAEECAEWLTEYALALDGMAERGEL